MLLSRSPQTQAPLARRGVVAASDAKPWSTGAGGRRQPRRPPDRPSQDAGATHRTCIPRRGLRTLLSIADPRGQRGHCAKCSAAHLGVRGARGFSRGRCAAALDKQLRSQGARQQRKRPGEWSLSLPGGFRHPRPVKMSAESRVVRRGAVVLRGKIRIRPIFIFPFRTTPRGSGRTARRGLSSLGFPGGFAARGG